MSGVCKNPGQIAELWAAYKDAYISAQNQLADSLDTAIDTIFGPEPNWDEIGQDIQDAFEELITGEHKPIPAERMTYTLHRTTTAEEINQWWKEKADYKPPYKAGTTVDEIILDEDTKFVRVYNPDANRTQAGGWVMKAEDIAGLTPEQIKDKYALDYIPTKITDAVIPKGTMIRRGIAGEIEGWGHGGGLQFDLMGERVGKFINDRDIPAN